MYNNFSNNFGSSSYGTASQGVSQYQGFQKPYQPVGYVQSFYGQSAVTANQPYGQAISPDAYHTANYRGNQLGHDNYLRSDSMTPAQQQVGGFQTGFSTYGMNTGINNTASQFGINQSQFGFRNQQQQQQQQFGMNQFAGKSVTANQQYGQAISPDAYHTANYRGNQLGHDNYLRSDSMTPAQQQIGGFQAGYNTQSVPSYSTGINNVGQQFGYNSAY
ncbi:hypothetical protein B5M42_003735 [Paenibacillus athensensis]|uniref:hypothetical protein n=1 Tax=Paenibacillus athensensis TaxID=1967502 RepID=UPI001ADDD3EF|nr:hypothetical protein [Paenibacillus athensensis]MCD1257953.1 hypothetical protein [Paenibacillus athensensis]